MNEFIYNFLEPLGPFIPLLVLLFNLKRVRALFEMLLLFILYAGLFALELIASFYALYDKPNNLYYNCISIFSFLIISYYFYTILNSKRWKRSIKIIITPAYIIFFCIYTFFLKKDSFFNSYSFALLSIVFIIYSFYFYWERFTIMEYERIQDDYRFWIVSSFFIYYIGSFFIFLSLEYLTSTSVSKLTQSEMKYIGVIWGIHNVIYFISCSLSAYGLIWKKFRTKFI